MIERQMYAVIVGLACVVARAETNETWTFFNQAEFHGEKYCQLVSSRDLDEEPTWRPETEPCPLPLPDAIQLARMAATNAFPEITIWKFVGSSVQQSGFPGMSNSASSWYYTIDLDDGDPTIRADMVQPNRLHVRVGLNRSVAPIVKYWDALKRTMRTAETAPNKAVESDGRPAPHR